MCMKLAQDLKRRFLHMIESVIGSRGSKEINDGEEPRLEFTMQQVTVVQERGITLKTAARGPNPKRRVVRRGPPAQTG